MSSHTFNPLFPVLASWNSIASVMYGRSPYDGAEHPFCGRPRTHTLHQGREGGGGRRTSHLGESRVAHGTHDSVAM